MYSLKIVHLCTLLIHFAIPRKYPQKVVISNLFPLAIHETVAIPG